MTDYYQLQDNAHRKWMEAQDIITRAETLYDHDKIDEAEWYRMLADARMLQEKAIELEKLAANAQVLHWREKFASIEETHSEYYARMHDERP